MTIQAVQDEMARQDEKWGEQNHTPADWLAILGEEVGEANQAYLNARFGYDGGDTYEHMTEELIQVAAVAVQAVAALRRGGFIK